ncbi:hypothetical protein KJ628_01590 [Patescibacteria group bacterium]|nr:hypothetical protein [Patescibacteria group bacterium]
METYTDAQIIAKLQAENKPLFTLDDFARLFKVKNRNTLYKIIQRLEKRKVATHLKSGSYKLTSGLINPPLSDFRLANFLYRPSYISLETALSLYGIITGFSYAITSVSIKKTTSISLEGKEFSYSSISPKLFWGYEKITDHLIADPEKSLLDYFYFAYKGLRSNQLDEFDFSIIKKYKLKRYIRDTKNNNLISFIKKITGQRSGFY